MAGQRFRVGAGLNPHRLLREIPETSQLDFDIQQLAGGLTNRSYLLVGAEQRYVLRINRDAPGIDRHREALVLDRIAGRDLGPEIVRVDSQAGYLLYHYLDAEPWPTGFARSEAGQQQIGRHLRKLHDVAVDGVPAVNVLDAVAAYIAQLPSETQGEFLPELERVVRLVEARGFHLEPPALCHLDLTAGNILGRGPQVRLLDWEFAGRAVAALDLAVFINDQGLTVGQAGPLLATYAVDDAQRDHLAALLPACCELVWLLTRTWLKAAGGDVTIPLANR